MKMIRTLTFVSILATSFLSAVAQPKAKFHSTQFDLGNIAWHSKSEAVIKLTNSGNKPLLITDVHPDCDCTAVKYDRNEVAPGKSTNIITTFDAETLGHFSRLVSITTNAAAEPTDVLLTGHVQAIEVDHTAEFAFHVDAVHLSANTIDFGDVNKGDKHEVVLSVYNSSKKDYIPSFLHLPKWANAVASPEVLKPGRIGHVTFTACSNELTEMGVNKSTIYVARHQGDKIRKEAAMTLTATLLPSLQEATENNADIVQTNAAPVENISEIVEAAEDAPVAVIPYVVRLTGKKKQKGMLKLENQGTAPLHVTALQVLNPGIEVSLSDSEVKPGGKATLKVTAVGKVNTSQGRPRILMITDDPAHPKIEIDLIVQ